MIVPYIVGDVHLGRKFVNGVPLHRRGDRERMVKEDFAQKLRGCTSELFVQTGDLFDGFTVDEIIVLETALLVREEARKNPKRVYAFYRGNHDASKDANKASSFDIFAELMHGFENVLVLKEPCTVKHVPSGESFGFLPWSPFKSSTELAFELVKECQELGISELSSVFCHCDVESYGGGHDFNMVPTNVLNKITKTVYTGHVHTPTKFERDCVVVNVVGSMQPYSHGEDPYNLFYKTTTFAEFSAYGETEKGWCRNLNMRILVKDGEVPEPIDCLSFITKKAKEKDDNDEQPDLDVRIEDFDMDRLFADSLAGRGVGKTVNERILAKWGELKNAAT